MKALVTVEEAIAAVDAFSGPAQDFELPISDDLQDAMGLSMAMITDCVLKRGWMPDGFEQCDGFRIYRYKDLGGHHD